MAWLAWGEVVGLLGMVWNGSGLVLGWSLTDLDMLWECGLGHLGAQVVPLGEHIGDQLIGGTHLAGSKKVLRVQIAGGPPPEQFSTQYVCLWFRLAADSLPGTLQPRVNPQIT